MTTNAAPKLRLGIDFGGTKIEHAVLAPDGSVLVRDRHPTPPGYDDAVRSLAALVQALETKLGPVTVGVGIPGVISPATGLVKNANSICLNGHALDRDLAEALGQPVRIENDANCFALSEASDGAGAGARTVFGVIIGTGVRRRHRGGWSGRPGA